MADVQEKREVDRLVADFGAAVEDLRREGVPAYPPLGGRTPWAETPETEKLEQIVWESMTVRIGKESSDPGAVGPQVIAVPGVAALEAIERNVDYAGLPASQREMLQDLRAGIDTGLIDAKPPDYKDRVAIGLARVVGVSHFDGMVQSAKEGEDRLWATRPEDDKVRTLVDMAQVAGPPVTYTLAVIEREVDYEKLSPWRREALEGLRQQLDRGELAGENPNPLYQGDRADLALRMTEFEARVEDCKRLGALDAHGARWP
jgi:hypothetical protein